MSNDKLRELLDKLHVEIRDTGLDKETRARLQALDKDIHGLLGSEEPGDQDESVMDRAKLLEAEFASSYPVAERVMREIIDTLVRLGI